jgi:hypothetical protein
MDHILSNIRGVFPIVPEQFRFKTWNGIHTPNNKNTKLGFIIPWTDIFKASGAKYVFRRINKIAK